MSPELPFALLASVVLGASAHRAGLCTVKAVAEVMTSRRGHVLWSFLKASLWTTGFLTVAAWLGHGTELVQRPVAAVGLFGGLLFGLGAGWNGACAFSTLSRLAEGHVVMLFTLAGWAVASPAVAGLWPGLHTSAVVQPSSLWPLIPVLLWVPYEIWGLWRRRAPARDAMRTGHWPLSVAVLLIALANAALLLMGRPWSFTSTVICTTGAAPMAPCAQTGGLWLISASALAAMIASARLRGGFRLRRPRPASAARHFGAGLVMGAGAALIPGGNDGLILFGLPSLSPHALPAWAALVLGVWLALSLMRLVGGRIPLIRCDADVCKSVM